ncbi:MAG: LysR family transcriptional regulator [Pseudomonadota bacterium]
MNISNLDWDDIKTFRQVAQNRTVRGAAKILKIHHSTVSRRIESLETALAVRLFDRTPEGYVLTGAGETLLAAAQDFAEDLLNVERQISGQDNVLSGIVTVTMAPAMAEMVFAPKLHEFANDYPELDIHLLTGSTMMDVSRREADIAIRMDNNPPDMLVGKRLFPYFQTVYASQAYLDSVDLKGQPEIGRWINFDERCQRYPDWTQNTEFAEVPAYGYFPDVAAQRAAAGHGLGLAMLPCLIGDSAEGLVRATRRPPIRSRDIWILTHSDLRHTARIRAFMGFAERVIRQQKKRISGDT